MLASEVVRQLQALITQQGDHETDIPNDEVGVWSGIGRITFERELPGLLFLIQRDPQRWTWRHRLARTAVDRVMGVRVPPFSPPALLCPCRAQASRRY
jgi:hypothetical protein